MTSMVDYPASVGWGEGRPMGEACIPPHNESDTHVRQPDGHPLQTNCFNCLKNRGHVLEDTNYNNL